jgi:hypothetical protein
MPRVVPALVLTAALAVLTACGSNAPSGGAASTAPSAASSSAPSTGTEQPTSTEQTASAGSSAASQAGAAQVIALTVTAGDVSGDTGRVDVGLGSPVRIEVTADVADEVHVHGYDLMVDTVPGQPVTVEFTADIPGVFEVELEGSKLPLTRLQVQ